jgi:hypothetical protein
LNDGACKDNQEAGAQVSIEDKQRVVTDAKPRQTTYAKRQKSVHRETSVSKEKELNCEDSRLHSDGAVYQAWFVRVLLIMAENSESFHHLTLGVKLPANVFGAPRDLFVKVALRGPASNRGEFASPRDNVIRRAA